MIRWVRRLLHDVLCACASCFAAKPSLSAGPVDPGGASAGAAGNVLKAILMAKACELCVVRRASAAPVGFQLRRLSSSLNLVGKIQRVGSTLFGVALWH